MFGGVNDNANVTEYLFKRAVGLPQAQEPLKWVAWVTPTTCLVVCLAMFIARYMGQAADKRLLAHGEANKTIKKLFEVAGPSLLDARKQQSHAIAPPKKRSKNKRE